MQNLGWSYYKDYYQIEGFFEKDAKKEGFTQQLGQKNAALLKAQIDDFTKVGELLFTDKELPGYQCFELKTVYPGLLCGAGMQHETGKEGEFKLGAYFDHSTGLPLVPGSSVKGTLRSLFKKDPAYVADLLKQATGTDWNEGKVRQLEDETFEGKLPNGDNLSIYRRDIFLEAVAVHGKPLLAKDYLTPHKGRTKNPVPLLFLKIAPNVRLRFQFRLFDGTMAKAEQKLKVFQAILEDWGIGAKTSVNYGTLTKS